MIKLRKKQKGFTLVELLIVIAIIAVLAAVVTPVALSAINNSKATAVYAEIKSIETAYLTNKVADKSTALADLELNGVDKTTGVSKNAKYEISTTTLKVEVASSTISGLVKELLDESSSSVFTAIELTSGE